MIPLLSLLFLLLRELAMKVFNLIFQNLGMIIAYAIEHLGPFLKDVGVCWVCDFEELMLLLHKDAIVDEEPP